MTKHPSFRPRMIHRNVNRDTLVMFDTCVATKGIPIIVYARFLKIIL